METTYRTLEEFYAADERRRQSGEADYGVNWTMGMTQVVRARYRVSYVRTTGELYSVKSDGGNVTILGTFPPDEAGPGEIYYHSLDAVLEGWPEQGGQPGGLQWVRDRLAQSDRGTVALALRGYPEFHAIVLNHIMRWGEDCSNEELLEHERVQMLEALAQDIAANLWQGFIQEERTLVRDLVEALGRVRYFARRQPWTGLGDAKEYPFGVGLLKDLDDVNRRAKAAGYGKKVGS